MALALGLLALLLFTIGFHFYSPWWFTPLASNWGSMDDTIVLTFWICGVVFIAISIFLVYCILKFRYSPDRSAEYRPENKRLEVWLTAFTTLGVVALLGPGLKVWSDYTNVPEDAHIVEAVAQQWQWMYRYPGEDNKLGSAHVKHVTFDNPTGVNPDDPHGQDDIVIVGQPMHLPINKPVKVLLRSKDVLHDFYVPQFRAKMDIVPGLVSYLWFTPTVEGSYEIVCAELCGIGHYNMRGEVVVDTELEYQRWLARQATFSVVTSGFESVDPLILRGQQVAQNNACLGCHSLDGGSSVGPSWKGMYGKTEMLADGSTVIVDDAYILESIRDPNAKIVKGYAAMMPASTLSDDDLNALLAFARSGSDLKASLSAIEADLASVTDDAEEPLESGETIAQTRGCIACHSITGTVSVGPSWLGLAGSVRELVSGESVSATREYLKESITNPNAQIVKGFAAIMPLSGLSEEEVEALVDYIESID